MTSQYETSLLGKINTLEDELKTRNLTERFIKQEFERREGEWSEQKEISEESIRQRTKGMLEAKQIIKDFIRFPSSITTGQAGLDWLLKWYGEETDEIV